MEPLSANPVSAYPGAGICAYIDREAFQHNIRTLARRVAPAELMCVLKADAYGHGIAHLAEAALAAGARHLGVATVPEALQLRDLLIQLGVRIGDVRSDPEAVRVLTWLIMPGADISPLITAGVEVAAAAPQSIAQVVYAARQAGQRARIHLKVDTGLGRNGLTPEQLTAALAELAASCSPPICSSPGEQHMGIAATSPVEIVGVMTHLAKADEPHDPATAEQLQVFARATEQVRQFLARYPHLGNGEELCTHAANSPGALSLEPVPGTMARVGLALYGLSPFEQKTAADLGLRPVMRVESQVVTVKHVPAGHGASYGFSYRAPRDTQFVLVAGGYADGIPRAVSNRAEVSIGGVLYPVVGRVAMDQFIVDIGSEASVTSGDRVVLIADGHIAPDAAAWGEWSDSINYEIVTRMGVRVPRVVSNGGAASPQGACGCRSEGSSQGVLGVGSADHMSPEAEAAAEAAEQVVVLPGQAALRTLARRIATRVQAGDVLILDGNLGAALGVRGRISSPTFIIAREYASAQGGVGLVHVDAYRLGSVDELEELDLGYALSSSILCVEWGGEWAEALSDTYLHITLEHVPGAAEATPASDNVADEPRYVSLRAHGARWRGVPSELLYGLEGVPAALPEEDGEQI